MRLCQIVIALGFAVPCVAQPRLDGVSPQDLQAQAQELWTNGPKLSPFQAIRWQDATPQVQVNNAWYELVSLNDIPTGDIMTFCKQVQPDDFQKRFDEDLPAVLTLMGHDPGTSVTLVVKDLQTGQEQTLEKVEMTKENRRAILLARNGASTTQPANVPWNGYPKLSPFQAIRWNNQSPQVQVNNTWYDLVAINDVPADQIVSFSASLDPDTALKHFEEDLVELLTRMDHKPGNSATLKVKELSTGQEQVIKDVPMTAENRWAIWKARNAG
jgi:hypothetical protein